VIEFRVLGTLNLLDADGREIRPVLAQPKRVALLTYLAASPRGFHRRDSLVALFWPELDQEHARGALRQALHGLRRSLTDGAIVSRGDDEIGLGQNCWCDALAFERAIETARHDDALRLYRGDLLDGFFISGAPEFERWLENERARLRRRAVESAWTLADSSRAAGDVSLAAHWARHAAGLVRDDEEALRRLIAILGDLGDRAGALQAYDVFARRLAEEYEVEPAAETRALIAAVRSRENKLPAERSRPSEPEDRPEPVDRHALAGNPEVVDAVPIGRRPHRQTVGRDRERRELRIAFDSVLSGRALVLGVAGEPGIGKTTLIEDFVSDLTVGAGPYRMAKGRCSERLAGTEAYLPLLEALGGLLRGPGVDAVSSLMKQHAPTWYLQTAGTSIDDLSERVALAHVQASSQERMKRELSAFFEELSRVSPVLLFLDDLHWADASTVDMLAYLATRFASMRMMIVVTYRPSELLLAKHPFSQLKLDLQSRGACRELQLELLSAGDVERYLAVEFPGHQFPATFSALIHTRTEGSPLFMTDLLRYLRTRGVIANERGSWIVTQSVPLLENDLPESTRAMIQRKIEQLGESDRNLLTAAAVQGYEFESAVVAAATVSDAAEVEGRLEALDHAYGFVRRAGERQLAGGALSVRYRFVHVLYMNALYGTLTPTRRAKLSLLVAEALLEHYGAHSAEVASNLALLFEVGCDIDRAVDYLLFGAQNSSRVFANQEAIVLAQRGLALLDRLASTPERIRQEMLLQLALALPLGATRGVGHPDVGAAYGRAYDLWKQSGTHGELFGVPAGLWGFYIVGAQMGTATALAKELLRFAERSGDPAMLVIAHDALGITLHHSGEHRLALKHFESGIAVYSIELSPTFSTMPIEPGVSMLSESARVLWVLGYPDRALRRLAEAMALSERVPHPEARGFAPVFGAFLHQLLGDVSMSLKYTEAVIAVARDRDIATTLAWGTVQHGWALAQLGRIEEGIGEMLGSLAAQRAAGSIIAHSQFLAMLAEAFIAGSRFEEALTAVNEGLQVAETTGDHYWDSELLRHKAELLLVTTKDVFEAESCLSQAIAHARDRGAKSHELRATMNLARLWRNKGRKRDARHALGDIYGWFTEGFDTADLIEARTLIAGLS
jgi:DNA-binding SARP family transcriptional activator/predicted ATPase